MLSKDMFRDIVQSIRQNWRALFVTDIIFKAFAFCVLTPILGLCQRITIWLASDGLLSDVDFVYLFTQPIGLICLVLVASMWLAITGLEQASLIALLWSSRGGRPFSPLAAIRYALAQTKTTLSLTAALAGISLAVVLPVALIGFVVYRALLGSYDINFYLHSQPEEFRIALCFGVLLAVVTVGITLWLCSVWFVALPISILEKIPAKESLRISHRTLRPRRVRVLAWLTVWLATVFFANLLLAGIGGWAGRLLLPSTVGSLLTLATRVGVLMLVLAAISLLLNLIANVSLASMVYAGYRSLRSANEPQPSGEEQASSPRASRFLANRWRLLACIGIGLLFATWLGVRSIWNLPLEDNAAVMAHRGASAEAPENTIAAFQKAIDDGADWIELDVQESADGEVIVMHDSDFMRQANRPLKVWDARASQLADMDIGSWFAPQFAGERVPTLKDVLLLCRDRVGVNIELKYYGHDQELEKRVIQIVESTKMTDQVMVMSLKKEGVMKARQLRPQWKIGLLMSIHAGSLDNLDIDFVAINHKFATRSFVRRMHAADKEVYVWTVNDAATMSQMLNRGVDGLLTDRPGLAKRVLAERAKMGLPERLLCEISAWLLDQPTSDY